MVISGCKLSGSLLAAMSVKDLGFTEAAGLEAIYERARKLGLRQCLLEVAPQLRLQYPNQPKYDWLMIATTPYKRDRGSQYLFLLDNDRVDKGLQIALYFFTAERTWELNARFVFIRGK
jgi:hypothetical protein